MESTNESWQPLWRRQEQQQEHTGKKLCALLLRHCASPCLVLDFLFFFLFSPFFVMAFSCSHGVLHAPRAYGCCCSCYCFFLVAAVLHFVGCGTSGGSGESLPSLCLYPNALILKAFKIFVRFRRHCSCLRRCLGHLF